MGRSCVPSTYKENVLSGARCHLIVKVASQVPEKGNAPISPYYELLTL